jgi:hypothetical protein
MEGLVVGLGATKISEDVIMSSATDAAFADFATHKTGDTLPFYEAEGQVLTLWDQLNELKLEQALLEARNTTSGARLLCQVHEDCSVTLFRRGI